MSKVIDIHAHVFNLKFLPVAGTIKGIGKAFLSINIPNFLCRFTASALLDWADRKEYELSPLTMVPQPVPTNDPDALFNTILDSSNYDELLTEEEGKEIEKFYLENFGDSSLEVLNLNSTQLDQLSILNTDQVSLLTDNASITFEMKSNAGYYRSIGVSALKKLRKSQIGLYIDWLIILTDKYKVVTENLFTQYSEISLFIHHDMDMDNWYQLRKAKGATYPYETEQVARIKQLMVEEEGKLLSFYAYNPDSNYGISKLKEAILGIDSSGNETIGSQGYIGVKFYPASGYKPWYEGDELKDQKLKLRQENNLALYDFCVEHKIPILTHCNYSGMRPDKFHYKFGDVKYWAKILGQPGNRFNSLKICFGHAGGQGPWIGEFKKIRKLENDSTITFEKSYPGQIFHLSRNHPNIYVDFGYYPAVADDTNGAQNKFVDQLSWCIEESKKANLGYDFSQRIMYGTDWHMLLREHAYEGYHEKFKTLFENPKLEAYNDLFFYQNALEFLNIPDYLAPNNKYVLAEDFVNHIKDKFYS